MGTDAVKQTDTATIRVVRTHSRFLRPTSIAGIAIGLAFGLALNASGRVTAEGARQGRECSDHTLKGDFGLMASGVRRVPFGPHAGQVEMIVGTAMRTYDGSGGFTEVGGDLHGQLSGVTPDPGQITGTYTVNPDCTGTSILSIPNPAVPPIISTFVIVDNGKQVKEAVMQPTPNVVTVLLDRK
jgi:hypothetical protein